MDSEVFTARAWVVDNFGSYKFEIRKFAWTDGKPQGTQSFLGFLLSAVYVWANQKARIPILQHPGSMIPRILGFPDFRGTDPGIWKLCAI